MTKKKTGSFLPDSVALLVFSLLVGFLVFLFEKMVLDFTMLQWVITHTIYSLRYLTGYLCGKMADFFGQYFRRATASAIALCLYATPVYAVAGIIAGASFRQILFGSMIQVVSNIFFGWLYGLVLDRVRHIFRLKLARPQA